MSQTLQMALSRDDCEEKRRAAPLLVGFAIRLMSGRRNQGRQLLILGIGEEHHILFLKKIAQFFALLGCLFAEARH